MFNELNGYLFKANKGFWENQHFNTKFFQAAHFWNDHMTAPMMWCCHQIWNNLWYSPPCPAAVLSWGWLARHWTLQLLHWDTVSYYCFVCVLVCLFWSSHESIGQAFCGFALVKCHHFCEMPLPLGDPLTPWLWATEPCCPCVWSAARCSEGQNNNTQYSKIGHHGWNHWFCDTWDSFSALLWMYIYLITGLISVIDSLLRHHFRSKEIGKFAKVDPVPQTLLQFGGRRQVLLQAGFHPPRRTG